MVSNWMHSSDAVLTPRESLAQTQHARAPRSGICISPLYPWDVAIQILCDKAYFGHTCIEMPC